MSTAIALRDMSPMLRHRSQPSNTTATSSKTQGSSTDPWLDHPHDAATTQLPLETATLTPTNTYWITPHSMLTSAITILDLTQDLRHTTYPGSITPEFKATVQQALKDHTPTPLYTCTRTSFLGLKYRITTSNLTTPIAEWTHPWTSVGAATLTFPPDSPHSSHPITLRNKRWGMRSETFTVDSQPYVWESDSWWHGMNLTLYKVIREGDGEAEKKVEVAKYSQKWWGAFVTGGVLVLDEKEVNGCVACLTLCVVLKKKRQRAGERRNCAE